MVADEHLFAPQLAPIEAGHVLRRAELAHRISSLEATAGYRDVVGLRIELLNFEPFAQRIWELRFNLTPYDAWYVACAEALAVPWPRSMPALAGRRAPLVDSCCPGASRNHPGNPHEATASRRRKLPRPGPAQAARAAA